MLMLMSKSKSKSSSNKQQELKPHSCWLGTSSSVERTWHKVAVANDMWLGRMTNAWLFPSDEKEATPSTIVSTSGDQPHPSRSGLLEATAPSTTREPLDRPIPTSHDSRALALELYDSSRARLWGMFFVASSAHRDPDSSRRHRHGLDGGASRRDDPD
ncbi:hypothetical protein CEP54_001720 [Fusarium duplospermum]|uniref:Uncharacterized protein n=1 Tax=Fusarium duplospermum TaxID=1325734 RepID=A0A428QZ92_9HYPO|nr:hypothetical protein CEP54_001720 [Fusarium duplospermum]